MTLSQMNANGLSYILYSLYFWGSILFSSSPRHPDVVDMPVETSGSDSLTLGTVVQVLTAAAVEHGVARLTLGGGIKVERVDGFFVATNFTYEASSSAHQTVDDMVQTHLHSLGEDGGHLTTVNLLQVPNRVQVSLLIKIISRPDYLSQSNFHRCSSSPTAGGQVCVQIDQSLPLLLYLVQSWRVLRQSRVESPHIDDWLQRDLGQVEERGSGNLVVGAVPVVEQSGWYEGGVCVGVTLLTVVLLGELAHPTTAKYGADGSGAVSTLPVLAVEALLTADDVKTGQECHVLLEGQLLNHH